MIHLGFVSSKEVATERALLLDFWKLMKGDENSEIHEQTLKVFLCCIMNFSFPWMMPPHVENEEIHKVNAKNLGTWDHEGKCLLNCEEIIWVYKHFSMLLQNR